MSYEYRPLDPDVVDNYRAMEEAYDSVECCPTEMPCPKCKEGKVTLKVDCVHDSGGYWEPPYYEAILTAVENDCDCTIDEQYQQLCNDEYAP